MIRVAYVLHGFHVGGIERCVAHLVNHLDRDRFEPLIIALTTNGAAAEWIERVDVRIWEVHRRAGNDPQAVLRLARVLRNQQVDVVHSHNWGTLVETALARRWAGVRVHVHSERGTVMGDLDLTGAKRWLRSTAMQWSLRRADAVVSNAFATARKVERMCGFPAERITVIPNGVDCPPVSDRARARSEIRRQLQVGEDATLIGSVGRLVPVKNFGMAIDAAAQLRRRGRDVHVLLVGAGPERSSLAHEAATAGIASQVHLVGHQNDIGRWLSAMDIYVNCSESEGMSQSLVEAMAMGLPLVVTDVGDSAWLLGAGPLCGKVVPAGDAQCMCRAISDLAGCRQRMAECGAAAGERHRSRYNRDAMIEAYELLYCDLQTGARTADRDHSVSHPQDVQVCVRAVDGFSERLIRGSAE